MPLVTFYNPRKHWKTYGFGIKWIKKPSGYLKNQNTGIGERNTENAGNVTFKGNAGEYLRFC